MFQVATIINEAKRNSLLFDDVNFSRSKAYFGALQHLNLFDEWLNETLQNLDHSYSSFLHSFIRWHKDGGVVDESFRRLLEKYRERIGSLRLQIKHKTEEITSLRDGVRDTQTLYQS